MNEAAFQVTAVPRSMFRKRRNQHQINFKRRRRKHEIDLRPQSPLCLRGKLKNLLQQIFKQRKDKIQPETTGDCLIEGEKDISPTLIEITRNFFARDDPIIQAKSETSISSAKSTPSLEELNKSNLESEIYQTRQSLNAREFLDTDFFSFKTPLEYSVYPVHIFHYKRNVNADKDHSNPETSQGHNAEVIYERKYHDKKCCKAAKHNVKTSTKGLKLYCNTSTQFEDVTTDELSNLCTPQVTHKLAQYFELNPSPIRFSKREGPEEMVTNVTEYSDARKGRSVLLNSHGKKKRTSPEGDDDKERHFFCHQLTLSSDESTNKSSSNEDIKAVYQRCRKCSLKICNCANSMANQKGSGMLRNDGCTSTTEMCICSAMYPKFKEWYRFNTPQFDSDLKKWQESQKLNMLNKKHHCTGMQGEDDVEKPNRKNMVDNSVTPFVNVKPNKSENSEDVGHQRYPTFIGMAVEDDEPITVKKDERKKKKTESDGFPIENQSEPIEDGAGRSWRKSCQSNPKTETECQIDLLRKSDFELVSDIEKMVENLITKVPSLSKNICKAAASPQEEPSQAGHWPAQEEPKPDEYWTLRKISSKELTPNLQLQPLNPLNCHCFHVNQTHEGFQQPQTVMPLFHKRTKRKPEPKKDEAKPKLTKQLSTQAISNLPKLQHISATAITISEPEISRTRADAKISVSKLTQPSTVPNPKKEKERISTITYIKKRDALSSSKETQILIKTQTDKTADSSLNVTRSKASVSTKSSQSSNKSSVHSFIKSLLLCLRYTNSDSQVSFHDVSVQCSESTRNLPPKKSASNCSLKATDKTESLFSSCSSDVESVENSERLRNEETNTAVQETLEKGTMKVNLANSVGVQVYITTKHVKDKKTSASSLTRRRRKRRKLYEASTQTCFDALQSNLIKTSSSSVNLKLHRHRQRSRKRKVITRKRGTRVAKPEKQSWNTFCDFMLHLACSSFLRLSNVSTTTDNLIEIEDGHSTDLKNSRSKFKNSTSRSVSTLDVLKPSQINAEDFKSTPPEDIGAHNQTGKLSEMTKNELDYSGVDLPKENFGIQCDEIDLCTSLDKILGNEEKISLKFSKITKDHDINLSGYHTSEESIFGNARYLDSSSESKRPGDLFKPNIIPEEESTLTLTGCFKSSTKESSDTSFQSGLTPLHCRNQLNYGIYSTGVQPVFQLKATRTEENDEKLKNVDDVQEPNERYTFENIEDKRVDDEHVLRLRLLWLKSGLRKHISQLSNLKILPIYDGDDLKRTSMTFETLPPPILMKIGAKPFDFEIVNEEKKSEREEESEATESVTTESTRPEDRDAYTPIAQLVSVLEDKGKEKFEIYAILSVSSDSEEEGMELAKAIESEEGRKAFLKTMEAVPLDIPKPKEGQARECRCGTMKTTKGSKTKVDDIVAIPSPTKELGEQNIDRQLKRKLSKTFSNKSIEVETSFPQQEDIEEAQAIDTIQKENPLQKKQSHVILDTSNKAYDEKVKKGDTKRKFPSFKEIVDTPPDNVKLGKSRKLDELPPANRHQTKLPTLKDFTRAFVDKFGSAQQKIRLDSEAPIPEKDHAPKSKIKRPSFKLPKSQPLTINSKRTKPFKSKIRPWKQSDAKNISSGEDQETLRKSKRTADGDAQEKLKTPKKLKRITGDDGPPSSDLRKTDKIILSKPKTRSNSIPVRKPEVISEIHDETSILTKKQVTSEEEIREKLRKVLGEDYGIKYKIRGIRFNPFKERNKTLKSKIPVRKSHDAKPISSKFIPAMFKRDEAKQEDGVDKGKKETESPPPKTRAKLETLLNRLSNKLKETNDKIKQSMETKISKGKVGDFSKKLSEKSIPEKKKGTPSSCTGLKDASKTGVPTAKSKMKCFEREVIKKSSCLKICGLQFEKPTTFKPRRKLGNITTAEEENQTTDECRCPRIYLELNSFESYHNLTTITEDGQSKSNFESQFSSESPTGRLICDCKELKATKKLLKTSLSKELSSAYLSETEKVTLDKLDETYEVPLSCGVTEATNPNQNPKSTIFNVEIIESNSSKNVCRIKYCGIQHPIFSGENFFEEDEKFDSWTLNYCGIKETKSPFRTKKRPKDPKSARIPNLNEVSRPEIDLPKLERRGQVDDDRPFQRSKFWQTYYAKSVEDDSTSSVSKTSSLISFYHEIVRPKSSSTVRDEEDAFRLSKNNSEINCFVDGETPSYFLIPVRRSRQNSLCLDQKRSLKMLYPLDSETELPSSDLSATSTSKRSLFKSKNLHVIPDKSHLSVDDKSKECSNLWDVQTWNALELCPLVLQNYYRRQLRKLLRDERNCCKLSLFNE